MDLEGDEQIMKLAEMETQWSPELEGLAKWRKNDKRPEDVPRHKLFLGRERAECHISGVVYCSQKCFYLAPRTWNREAEQLLPLREARRTPWHFHRLYVCFIIFYYCLCRFCLISLLSFSGLRGPHAPRAKLAVKMLKMRISVIYQLGCHPGAWFPFFFFWGFLRQLLIIFGYPELSSVVALSIMSTLEFIFF